MTRTTKAHLSWIILLSLFTSCRQVSSESPTAPTPNSGVGKTGSLATFAIMGDHLYAINGSEIKSFNISVPAEIREVSTQVIDFGIETIFGSYPHLFIGGQDGLYVYDIGPDPANPTFVSQFGHARGCDPVVVDKDYAFVTLRNSELCPGSTNELKVLDMSNMRKPMLLKTYPLTAPIGLSSTDGRLYICDGNVLKLFDSSDIQNIQLISFVERKECLDIIYDKSAVIVTSGEGITQYEISNDNFELLSHLGF